MSGEEASGLGEDRVLLRYRFFLLWGIQGSLGTSWYMQTFARRRGDWKRIIFFVVAKRRKG